MTSPYLDRPLRSLEQFLRDRRPRFAVGTILRYAEGPTALFRVDAVYPHHGRSIAYYCGQHCMGVTVCAYHENCRAAGDEDLKTWEENAKWRRP